MIRRLLWPLLATLLLVGCSPLGSGRNVPPPTLEEVAELAHLQFPAGTELTSSTYQAALDWHVTAVVEFSRDQLDGFLAQNQLEPETGLRVIRDSDRQLEPAWDPEGAVDVLGIDLTGDPVEGVFRKFLFDLDRADVVVLYLVAFTT